MLAAQREIHAENVKWVYEFFLPYNTMYFSSF